MTSCPGDIANVGDTQQRVIFDCSQLSGYELQNNIDQLAKESTIYFYSPESGSTPYIKFQFACDNNVVTDVVTGYLGLDVRAGRASAVKIINNTAIDPAVITAIWREEYRQPYREVIYNFSIEGFLISNATARYSTAGVCESGTNGASAGRANHNNYYYDSKSSKSQQTYNKSKQSKHKSQSTDPHYDKYRNNKKF
jgi:hypothetical protein